MIFDLSELSIREGSRYLDEFLCLPRRCQEMFFALLEHDLYDNRREGMELIDTITSYEYLYTKECKSPIEQIFSLAYKFVIANEGFPFCEIMRLKSQIPVKANGHNYYADFLFDTSIMTYVKYDNPLRLVIECDGHDFHEKTKMQVARDNQRVLDLKFEGYDVIRFSGSQIFNDPIKCAYDAYNYIIKKVGHIDIDMEMDGKKDGDI